MKKAHKKPIYQCISVFNFSLLKKIAIKSWVYQRIIFDRLRNNEANKMQTLRLQNLMEGYLE